MFHESDNWYFERQDNGDVRILNTDLNIEHLIPASAWCSIVLSMSAFGESNHLAWLEHHMGLKDWLSYDPQLAAFEEGYKLGNYGIPISEHRVEKFGSDYGRLSESELQANFFRWIYDPEHYVVAYEI
jgi:hypothetical protein